MTGRIHGMQFGKKAPVESHDLEKYPLVENEVCVGYMPRPANPRPCFGGEGSGGVSRIPPIFTH